MNASAAGPVLFAFDGSDLAKIAIEEAGRQLAPGREAYVLTVWEPLGVKFVPVAAIAIDPLIDEVRQSAEQTAAKGASLATAAGFRASGGAVDATPTWKGIVDRADELDASLIVLGSHGRTGLSEVLVGSVAGAVASHSRRPVLIVHRG
jgi:nucleotide-binding universal stress UspA family protein